ncbi:MAG: 3D-(3,5/4)-trihydroxycyclohexane-1,2-dione acylhydrolase (decyclizing), partial [Pseudotabrizicola sp.]|nr:3D-(3,5/4)-trihydroxycyclohexane-1,2-dione acylhydrolase (decyclizing) [Pseudotabrizicola sp.]MDZ4311018.1 3D-(3,5/4)-trihydroxycyclohexane-1,2-dione acylhydrolase (decyclizing) [Cypionkella sp.]MDZ7575227.1 3D-(3,5/4)-trihydroxycyclohexane-1,2-dione acylhydrolase (decyclizing) [Pseudotabrizicola sp.]
GAHAVKAKNLADLQSALQTARGKRKPTVIVIDTTAAPGPGDGLDGAGHWWDVAVPQVGGPERLRAAYETYITNAARARLTN